MQHLGQALPHSLPRPEDDPVEKLQQLDVDPACRLAGAGLDPVPTADAPSAAGGT